MRLRLERRDPARDMARFYIVTLAPTLFGEVALVREWGRIGSAGTVRETWLASAGAAEAAALRLARRKRRRGYRRIDAMS
jgi:predicted DNA-binding WGR domain protein